MPFRMRTFVYSSLQETSEQKQQVKTERYRRCGRSRFSMMALRIWKEWRMSTTSKQQQSGAFSKGVIIEDVENSYKQADRREIFQIDVSGNRKGIPQHNLMCLSFRQSHRTSNV